MLWNAGYQSREAKVKSPLEILSNNLVAVESRSHPVKDPASAAYGS
jgi:hypothetical protein